jgi:hypothetical protein
VAYSARSSSNQPAEPAFTNLSRVIDEAKKTENKTRAGNKTKPDADASKKAKDDSKTRARTSKQRSLPQSSESSQETTKQVRIENQQSVESSRREERNDLRDPDLPNYEEACRSAQKK